MLISEFFSHLTANYFVLLLCTHFWPSWSWNRRERWKGKNVEKKMVLPRILEEEKWKWTWQLSGRQAIIDLSGDYRLRLWNPLFSNKIILKALEQLLSMQPVGLILLSVRLLIAQKVLLIPERTLLDFHYCNWPHTHGRKSTVRRSEDAWRCPGAWRPAKQKWNVGKFIRLWIRSNWSS